VRWEEHGRDKNKHKMLVGKPEGKFLKYWGIDEKI
jgi:hypothetical protein